MNILIKHTLTVVFVALLIPNTFAAEPVKVEGGLVEGTVEDGLNVYKGIPFAAPPVGDLRWKAPQAVVPWEGVLKADHFAPACPQMQFVIPGMPAAETSEDCLYLNIWAPQTSPGEKLPVMVWIYGGGFAMGSTSMPSYSGEQLAKNGVIMVSIAYRVGPLGFLAHPELSAESENHVSGNYGLLDQIAGLKWVQRNIEVFGGDPDRVTIFGESAGGISISMLAASPMAKGLFQGAISESGGSFAPACKERRMNNCMQTLEGAETAGVEFAKRMGTNSIAELREVDPEKWLQDPASQMGGTWPVIDGYVIIDDQYKLYEQGKYNDVPVLIGTNSDEGSMFVQPVDNETYVENIRNSFGPFADKVLELYPAGDQSVTTKSMADIFREVSFAWPTWTWARLQSKTGESKVFVYYFDQPAPSIGIPLAYESDGASHAAEIGYVFRHLDQNPMSQYTEEDRVLSEIISTYWTNFAKYGNPNGENIPQWPIFKEGEPTVMYLKGDEPHPIPVPNLDKLQLMEEYFAWKRGND